jgi:predicted deacetylase
VTPALASRVEALWALCAARGVTPALLVVPNWHGDWPLERYPDFVQWIRSRAKDGAEVFLHGERHDEVGSPRGWRDQWRAFGKTAREGEFLTLDAPAARERVERGLALFARLGLNPIGFVPPAWLARDSCVGVIGALGLSFYEDDAAIVNCLHRIRYPSPVVRWSARTPFRARGSVAVAEWRWRAQRAERYARIALHPSDLDSPITARSVERSLDRWVGARRPTRYQDLA